MRYTKLLALVLAPNTGSRTLLEHNGFQQGGFLPDVAEFEGKTISHVYYRITLESTNH